MSTCPDPHHRLPEGADRLRSVHVGSTAGDRGNGVPLITRPSDRSLASGLSDRQVQRLQANGTTDLGNDIEHSRRIRCWTAAAPSPQMETAAAMLITRRGL